MSVLLAECTTKRKELWSENVKTSEIYERMSVQYSGTCVGRRQVYEWVERDECW
jgi:hypothetical protein